jgi:hypothetical protein
MRFELFISMILFLVIAGPSARPQQTVKPLNKNRSMEPVKVVTVWGIIRVNSKDRLKYVWIPPGTFMMGCSPGEIECYDDERPSHRNKGDNKEVSMDSELIRDRIEVIVKAQWKDIKPVISPGHGGRPLNPGSPNYRFWEYRISPPFPAVWPPDGSGIIYYYAYAAAMNPNVLVDGEWLGPVWARVRVDLKDESMPRLEILTREIKELRIIGVRPLSAEEATVYSAASSVAAQLGESVRNGDLKAIDTTLMKKNYCFWSKNTGTGDALRAFHPDFFNWLGCKER